VANQATPSGSTRGWTIGHILGSPVVIAPSWFVAAAVLTFLVAPTVQAQAPDLGAGVYLVAFSFVLLLFASVFLHELAHGLVGRAHGIPVRQYAITLWGGHTEFSSRSMTPGSSALVSAVGPIVNLVLAALLAALWQVSPSGSLVGLVLLSGAIANGFVGVFNLLPGLPLDGGRILEAAVWAITGSRTRGTVAAGWFGRIVALGAVGWMLSRAAQNGGQVNLVDLIWAGAVGSMLWAGAGQAMSGAKRLDALDAIDVGALVQSAIALPAGTSMADAQQLLTTGGVDRLVLLGPDGAPVATVDGVAWNSVPAEQRAQTPLAAVAVPLPAEAVLSDIATGSELAQGAAGAASVSPVLILVQTGTPGAPGGVRGIVRVRDVIAALRG
jgi:Zn-dependent protease